MTDLIMSEKKNDVGAITWTDLTVEDADGIRDFYSHVVGWNFEFVSMGEYIHYSMLHPEIKKTVAGICHARISNADLPSQWLIYITVANIRESVEACNKFVRGALTPIKDSATLGRYCIIQDPGVAVCALFEQNL
jgi:uncharacterized protein